MHPGRGSLARAAWGRQMVRSRGVGCYLHRDDDGMGKRWPKSIWLSARKRVNA
ncbi:hypothetical protein BS47DRAFT_275616 [Hydnum rufescens UP504]|uniref:Uncharacterized protein n=1 Tax=Hydnum rufescens UP504 TaxID=1448309 RepID=A0A9P6AL01_9AGAM|nr:hypothetical protein BS47DRAFT_275616 [Hydnum rufescens UP504]